VNDSVVSTTYHIFCISRMFKTNWEHSAVYSYTRTSRKPMIRLRGRFCISFGIFIKLVRGRREMRKVFFCGETGTKDTTWKTDAHIGG
jgi:hypothetical protein